MRGLDNLKEMVDTAIKAENIEINVKKAEVAPEKIEVKPDIYINSNS